ncbi:hypothetical protein [Leisingera sp. NJS204]|uniref:hypothetical protein n=1 Tax=Leisingera sp. NJS204 TaxID=2508307 RepID=UPI0010110F7E|nr:hypothetical protein [Leisingera sp. NJS204]QAX31286.1 hypothetical protein ETW24_18940 [Leisingera sp. NJS204]
MVDLLTGGTNPPPAALSAEPYSIAELDAHQDADRIWATVLGMRRSHEAELSNVEDTAESDLEAALKGRDDDLQDKEDQIEDLADKVLELETQNSELEAELIEYMLAA